MESLRTDLARGLLAGTLGVGAFLALRGLARPGHPRPALGEAAPPAATWASDRDAGALFALDSSLIVLQRVDLRHPLEIEARADGGLWVVSAPEGGPLGPHRLTRTSPSGAAAASAQLSTALDLACLDGGPALVVEMSGDGSRRVLRVEEQGTTSVLATLSDASCVAGRGAEALVGTAQGEVVLLAAATGATLDRAAIGGQVSDVAAGPWSESWWALDASGGSGGARLLLLGASLEILWQVPAGCAALHLIPAPGEERVWLADASEPAAFRFGPGGALEVAAKELPLGGLDRGVAESLGGVLLVAPGALLRLDPQGNVVPGQGGFDFLVDVARAGPP